MAPKVARASHPTLARRLGRALALACASPGAAIAVTTATAALLAPPGVARADLSFSEDESNAAKQHRNDLRLDDEKRHAKPSPLKDPSIVDTGDSPAVAAPEESEDAPSQVRTGADAPGSPRWYRGIQKRKEADAASEALIRSEKPVVGVEDPAPVRLGPSGAPGTPGVGTATTDVTGTKNAGTGGKDGKDSFSGGSELSARDTRPPETNLLFSSKGLTDTLSFDAGALFLDQASGPTAAAGYAIGWWWSPEVIASVFLRMSGAYTGNYVSWMLTAGPQFRWLKTDTWVFTGQLGYAYSQGFGRTDTTHLPTPPDAFVLAARRGPILTLMATPMTWRPRSKGAGPTLSASIGKQDERMLYMLTLGFTFQNGRPNYTGDVTLEN